MEQKERPIGGGYYENRLFHLLAASLVFIFRFGIERKYVIYFKWRIYFHFKSLTGSPEGETRLS